MDSNTQNELARAFRAAHGSDAILVVANAFDVASAKVLAKRRPQVVGTTSAGIAWALGYPDGEMIPRHEMLSAIARIAAGVDVGVTADLEAGYGDAHAATETVTEVIASGVIGVNLEDAGGSSERRLLPPEAAAAKIAAARAAATRSGVDVVINARTDVFLAPSAGRTAASVAEAVRRGNLYLDAGADCVFVPGTTDPETIVALVEGLRGPLNVYATPGAPPPGELHRLGVARVSVGCGPYQACLALVEDITRALEAGNGYGGMHERQLAYQDVQDLFSRRETAEVGLER